MNDLHALKLLQRASNQLEIANEEINRPSEDVVCYSICFRAKCSLTDLLISYLIINDIDSSAANNLEDLQKMCSAIDKNFADLEFASMDCHPTKIKNEEHYCLGIERVKECLRIANRVKELVWQEYKKNEKKYSN